MDKGLDLLQPEIMAKAAESFEIEFAQGRNRGSSVG